jgi:hypothetical protein
MSLSKRDVWSPGFHWEETFIGPNSFGPVGMKEDFLQGCGAGGIFIYEVQNSWAVDIFVAMLTGGCSGQGGIRFPATYTLKAFEPRVYSRHILSPSTGEV